MPNNLLHEPWSEGEEEFVRTCGLPDLQMAHALNARFHGGQVVRTYAGTQLKRRSLGVKAVLASKPKAPPRQQYAKTKAEQKVERTDNENGISLRALGTKLRTVEDVLAHAEIDTTKYEIVSSTAKKWDVTIAGPDGAEQVENFAIAVDVKPKVGKASVLEEVEAIVKAAFSARKAPPVIKAHHDKGSLSQGLYIMDPHLGKRSWANETRGGHYDLQIATKTVREANATLIAKGDDRKVAERVIFIGGDFFNADTKGGTTTGGTPQDNDSRIPKMMQEGAEVMYDIVAWSAESCNTKVVIVPGNHDSVQVWALQLALQAYFRNDKRVTFDSRHTTRKYHQWGKCLLGLSHGDKAWKRLPALMSRESAYEWGRTTLHHIHHGHLHSKRQVTTVDGTTIFQHPALCEIDVWHSEEGYVSDRGQETYYYHSAGVLVGMDYYSPDFDKPVQRGTR